MRLDWPMSCPRMSNLSDRPDGWEPEDVKAELRKRFGPITRLSQEWGYHPTAITKTLYLRGYSMAVERLIASALELAPHTLWPDRWTPEGDPRPLRRCPNASSRRTKLHRQKRGSR